MKNGRKVLAVAAVALALSWQATAEAQVFVADASDGISPQREIIAAGGTTTRSLTLGAGWSMISLPVTPASGALTTLFPNAISAFRFAGGYQQVTTLNTCEGYWINLPAGGGTYPVTGDSLATCSRSLSTGWSMIGAPIQGTTLANIVQTPANSVISVFKFAAGYQQTTTLPQSGGYWVNLRNAAQLDMTASPTVVTKPVVYLPQAPALGSRLLVKANGYEQALLLGAPAEDLVALPPAPPAGVLDARADVNGVAMNGVPVASHPADYRLAIQGSGLELSWDIAVADAQAWQLVVDGQTHDLVGNGSLTFVEAPGQVVVRYAARPLEFALHGNYPNPFNPSTTIRYSVAEQVQVKLAVFDALGQRVRNLVNLNLPAGTYSSVWDGRDEQGQQVANGLYFVQLEAGQFHGVQKMLLLK